MHLLLVSSSSNHLLSPITTGCTIMLPPLPLHSVSSHIPLPRLRVGNLWSSRLVTLHPPAIINNVAMKCICQFLPGQCLPGTFSESGLEACETCPLGYYQSAYAQTECQPCPSGTSTWRRGTRTAAECGGEWVWWDVRKSYGNQTDMSVGPIQQYKRVTFLFFWSDWRKETFCTWLLLQ